MLDGRGEEASTVAGIWWLMFALSSVIFVVVLALLGVALFTRGRDRRRPPEEISEQHSGTSRFAGTPLVVAGGIVLPVTVMVVLLGTTLWAGGSLRGEAHDAVRIEVTGHRYWWDVEYPDLGIRTANEVRVPVDRDVELVLMSEDVIHSFWVPQVAGKLDLVPGRENHMTVRVTETGRFDGYCAEFCGLQHASMRFQMVALDASSFDDWVRDRSEVQPVPEQGTSTFEGWQVFLSAGCSYCHRIAGTPANSEFGPDLTDLGSRDRIAAGLLDNTRGDLGGWILDPQNVKPGNQMPATELSPEDLDPLLDYLESLR